MMAFQVFVLLAYIPILQCILSFFTCLDIGAIQICRRASCSHSRRVAADSQKHATSQSKVKASLIEADDQVLQKIHKAGLQLRDQLCV
ncbi:hypothetical protein K461DRAFT_3581 [Myriangium duriaei CBS 260.36]|uniref:Uncharacterized protein n=1 Tax=Myriangium duriaei CBS 260.36 TaxID=1168546 RepID=A0A9P4MKY5_9PEZI|nr:hypothetical protein K461DRAFT_3581 [Myriangium duriaei CBS 260.36]